MNTEIDKHDSTLFTLVMHLQSTAMIQLGKMSDPNSKEMVRDLDGARFSIDILEMLKNKCAENTHKEIVAILEKSVMDLQLNYMDEMKKEKAAAETAEAEAAEAETPSAEDAPADAESETGTEAPDAAEKKE